MRLISEKRIQVKGVKRGIRLTSEMFFFHIYVNPFLIQHALFEPVMLKHEGWNAQNLEFLREYIFTESKRILMC